MNILHTTFSLITNRKKYVFKTCKLLIIDKNFERTLMKFCITSNPKMIIMVHIHLINYLNFASVLYNWEHVYIIGLQSNNLQSQ